MMELPCIALVKGLGIWANKNSAAFHVKLEKHHLDLLDEAFPPPKKKVPLDML